MLALMWVSSAVGWPSQRRPSHRRVVLCHPITPPSGILSCLMRRPSQGSPQAASLACSALHTRLFFSHVCRLPSHGQPCFLRVSTLPHHAPSRAPPPPMLVPRVPMPAPTHAPLPMLQHEISRPCMLSRSSLTIPLAMHAPPMSLAFRSPLHTPSPMHAQIHPSRPAVSPCLSTFCLSRSP
jgi:hypothetical protein